MAKERPASPDLADGPAPSAERLLSYIDTMPGELFLGQYVRAALPEIVREARADTYWSDAYRALHLALNDALALQGRHGLAGKPLTEAETALIRRVRKVAGRSVLREARADREAAPRPVSVVEVEAACYTAGWIPIPSGFSVSRFVSELNKVRAALGVGEARDV